MMVELIKPSRETLDRYVAALGLLLPAIRERGLGRRHAAKIIADRQCSR
jgi:hypothetical protein